jgi:hypothetical protein
MFGAHASFFNTQIDDPSLTTNHERRFGVDPELGILIEAPFHVTAQASLRVDAMALALGRGVFMNTLAVGLGGYF